MTGTGQVRALIADDEPIARAGLRDMLQDVAWVTIVGEAADGPAAARAIDALRPDLVFLDIQMPGLTGTDVLRQVSHRPHVIFTTAWAQHAVTAFELGALDYLLKPFGAARLNTALERARAALGEPPAGDALRRLADTFGGGPLTRLFVRSGASIVPVEVRTVDWFEARGDYVGVWVGRARHLVHLSLQALEDRLDPEVFARIHRTHIVNLGSVKAFRREPGGRMVAELKDGTRLPVSRARARGVRGQGV